jgi:hypothetical protein
MLKYTTLVTAMVMSTAAFAFEQMERTPPVYGMEYCGSNPQPSYCPEAADLSLAQLMFDPQPIQVWTFGPQPEWTQERARQWFWAQYRAKNTHEAAPIGLVGEPWPPAPVVVQNCPQPRPEADARECGDNRQASRQD